GLIADRDASRNATAWITTAQVPEPLCAIYEPATLEAFLSKVNSGGNLSPRAWLQSVDACLLTPEHPDLLGGANTREEFELLTGRGTTPRAD
ncbi:MAG: molybdenum cofactor biosynthesis protein MoaAD, partial [Gammaproteobacteria bacterium]